MQIPATNDVKVTVIMPVYNAEAYIYEAIDSILQQSFQNFELLIIDDGSSDKSMEIVRKIAKEHESKPENGSENKLCISKIRVLTNSQNCGLVFTRNRGISEAKGEYIAWLDHDDIAMPNRLERQVNFMDKNPKIALLGGYTEYVDENGKLIKKTMPKINSDELPIWLLFQNCFQQCTVMIRKNALSCPTKIYPTKLAYREEFLTTEDYDLWVRLSKFYKIANLPEILAKHRRHTENTSLKMADLQKQNILKVLKYQLETLQIIPTETELILHQQLSHESFIPNLITYQNIAIWLTKLQKANNRLLPYSTIYFDKVIGEIWQKATLIHLKFGWKGLKIYGNCEITKKIKWLIHIKLVIRFLKSVI